MCSKGLAVFKRSSYFPSLPPNQTMEELKTFLRKKVTGCGWSLDSVETSRNPRMGRSCMNYFSEHFPDKSGYEGASSSPSHYKKPCPTNIIWTRGGEIQRRGSRRRLIKTKLQTLSQTEGCQDKTARHPSWTAME